MLSILRSRMIAYTLAMTASPLQFGVWLMAFWFTTNGPAAYLTCTSMLADPMAGCATEVFGFIPVTVNLCHMLCHLITGVIGLVAVLRHSWSALYALLGSGLYVAWGLLGLFGGENLRHHLGVDIVGTWVHVIEGLILLAIWILYRSRQAPNQGDSNA